MKEPLRVQRLKSLLELAQQTEQEALAQWGQEQQRLKQAQQQQQQLAVYIAEYRQQLALPSGRVQAGGQIHNTLGFIQQVESALTSQDEQVQLASQQVDAAQQRYLLQHQKSKSLDQLMSRLNKKHRAEQERQEQKEADEWASRSASLAPQRR